MRYFTLILLTALVICAFNDAQAQKRNRARCPRVAAFEDLGVYERRRDLDCFRNTKAAERRGYTLLPEDATPIPDATATPEGDEDFTGVWVIDEFDPAVTTCTLLTQQDPPSANDRTLDIAQATTTVSGDSIVTVSDGDGRRSWGLAASSTLDIFDHDEVVLGCAAGASRDTTLEFDNAVNGSADVTFLESLECGSPAETCTRTWSSTATKQ